MFCSTCGTLINEELNYCNRCGNRVAKNESAAQSNEKVAVLKSLSIATGFVGVVGVGGLIGLIAIIVGNRVGGPDAIFLAFLFAATVFGICFLLTRQISRLTETGSHSKRNSPQKITPEQLNSFAAPQIESPRESFVSVTENTTRTLDKTKV